MSTATIECSTPDGIKGILTLAVHEMQFRPLDVLNA